MHPLPNPQNLQPSQPRRVFQSHDSVQFLPPDVRQAQFVERGCERRNRPEHALYADAAQLEVFEGKVSIWDESEGFVAGDGEGEEVGREEVEVG